MGFHRLLFYIVVNQRALGIKKKKKKAHEEANFNKNLSSIRKLGLTHYKNKNFFYKEKSLSQSLNNIWLGLKVKKARKVKGIRCEREIK